MGIVYSCNQSVVIRQTQQCTLQTPAVQEWFALMALQSQRMHTGTHSYASKKPWLFLCLPVCNHSMQTTAPTDVTYVPQWDEGGRSFLTGCDRLQSPPEAMRSQLNLAAALVSLLSGWHWCGYAINPCAVPLLCPCKFPA